MFQYLSETEGVRPKNLGFKNIMFLNEIILLLY